MSRVSFGSRAGDVTDYGGLGTTFIGPRHARVVGPYDSLDALTDALADEFKAAAESTLPVCTTIELCLGLNAVLPLVRPGIGPYAEGGDHDLPLEFKSGLGDIDASDSSEQKQPRASCGAIINVVDPRAKQIVQRAASRGVIAAIEALDGFRYSFNNAWTAKDEEGARFSFICQDSMQNKDRHANGYSRILKHLKDPTGAERGPRKPTYDCKGSVSVKFSASRQSCDVFYRHSAIHDTVAARRPASRPAPAVKRTSSSWIKLSNATAAKFTPQGEDHTGGLSAMLQVESADATSPAVDSPSKVRPLPASSNIGRPLKRKREDMTRPPPLAQQAGQPLSLADLLRQSETAKAPPLLGDTRNTNTSRGAAAAAAVAYELPSWQAPPPPLNRPANGPPYQLPYQPQAQKVPITNLTPSSPMTPMISRNCPPNNLQQFRVVSAQKPGAGLFTTMKVVEKPALRWSQPSYPTPRRATLSVAHAKPRSVLACTSCRLAKRRCDEGRPMCGACSKTARTDCRYESPAHGQNQAVSNAAQQPEEIDHAEPSSDSTSAQPRTQPAQRVDRNVRQPQASAKWCQGSPPSGQHSQRTWSSETPSQQSPSHPAWGTDTSVQQPSQSNWSQDSTNMSSWSVMPQQSTNAQQWPPQNAPPPPTSGNLSMASSAPAKQGRSPDPWYPKRDR